MSITVQTQYHPDPATQPIEKKRQSRINAEPVTDDYVELRVSRLKDGMPVILCAKIRGAYRVIVSDGAVCRDELGNWFFLSNRPDFRGGEHATKYGGNDYGYFFSMPIVHRKAPDKFTVNLGSLVLFVKKELVALKHFKNKLFRTLKR
jgi:hypothetical protein